MGNNIIVHVSNNLTSNGITTFINKINYIFAYKGKHIPNFYLDFSLVSRVDILGVLLTYKILEYSVVNSCFEYPSYNLTYNGHMVNAIVNFGFENLIKSLANNEPNLKDKAYKQLKVEVLSNNCLVAPIALLRSDMCHSDEVIREKYDPIISEYYKSSPDVVEMILEVFTEVLNNFWSHALEDSKSVIAGYGNANQFEIVCTDNGSGIDGTIKEICPKLSSEGALLKAMEDGFTSKKGTNHMGYGLWFINQVVNLSGGKMIIISNDSIYINNNGKIRCDKCPYWKGTMT